MPNSNEYRVVENPSPPKTHLDQAWTREEPYLYDESLVEAINLAIMLGRPLLLEGEAGCGKTKVARAIAWQLGLPLHEWFVRSTSKARDGMYRFDSLLRLHDVQLSSKPEKATADRDPANPAHYVRFREVGEAFRNSREGVTSVLLIDEIDKADPDFANDLLTVLEEPYEFTVEETGEKIQADRDHLPIIIITSNREKAELSMPFLRRCVYHYIDFPDDPDRLLAILSRHHDFSNEPSDDTLAKAAAAKFLDLRRLDLAKAPGTSEFLDWYSALTTYGKTKVDPKQLEVSLPFPGLLLKVKTDLDVCRGWS